MSEEKWIKRVTEEDFHKCMTMEEMMNFIDTYLLQHYKDQQVKDADFEIIKPLQLPESKK